jgi:hypothetical protein
MLAKTGAAGLMDKMSRATRPTQIAPLTMLQTA